MAESIHLVDSNLSQDHCARRQDHVYSEDVHSFKYYGEYLRSISDKESLDSAHQVVEPSLKAAVAEKQDIENTLTELSRLCLPQEEQLTPHSSLTLRIRD